MYESGKTRAMHQIRCFLSCRLVTIYRGEDDERGASTLGSVVGLSSSRSEILRDTYAAASNLSQESRRRRKFGTATCLVSECRCRRKVL